MAALAFAGRRLTGILCGVDTTPPAAPRRRDLPPEHVAAVLRERLYGAISCLSTLLVLSRHITEVESLWVPVIDVVVATGGLWAASLLADYVSHLTAHGTGPRGAEAREMLLASAQILEAAAVPVVLLVAAALGLLHPERAVRIGIVVLIVSLALIAQLAARRTGLPRWKRIGLVVVMVGLGAVVVGIKTLAH